jgi:thiol-disulfide isomerase/thioredoxin
MSNVTPRCAILVSALFLVAGCSRSESSASSQVTQEPPTEKPKSAPSSAPVSATPLVLARGVRIVKAGAGDDATVVVRNERERAAADGRDLVVYVGAKWCEPCQRFHEAAQRGELDGDFPSLTLLEFDVDVDRERLVTAGYHSELIPLFVMPGSDGRATPRRFEGSVKGDHAVGSIAPRLRQILAK